MKGVRGLRWAVVAQLLRPGGLRSGPKVGPKSVDGRIAQLRAQARAEAKEKREAPGGEGERSGGLRPPSTRTC
eukprot:11199922-Lingulodinium_polyedra.AAC.1